MPKPATAFPLRPLQAACLAALLLASGASAKAPAMALRYIGQQLIPPDATFGGTRVGGLSSIDYDPVTRTYFAISDDRSERQPARYYQLDLRFDAARFEAVAPVAVVTLRGPDGNPYPASGIDPESIRVTPRRTLLYTSEGAQKPAPQDPFVREMRLDGSYLRDFELPAKFRPTADGSRGVRDNLAFESLTVVPGGATAFTATENALAQDGPAAAVAGGSDARILRFKTATGGLDAEYVYRVDAVATPAEGGGFMVAGLVELLALSNTDLIAVERSFSVGIGNRIRLYRVSLRGATNMRRRDSLVGARYAVAKKTLLLDLATLGIPLDNIEGVTFGPLLDNGARSLILVSDNNFSDRQLTQFLAFEVIESARHPASVRRHRDRSKPTD